MPTTTKRTTAKKQTTEDTADETKVSTVKSSSSNTNANKEVATKQLSGDYEVAVASFVPYRVSYDDSTTFDKYVWESVGDVQYMTLDVLTRMRRNHPDYFNNMELKPKDDRVVKKLNLNGLYDKYEHLMSADSYTRDNVGNVVEEIKSLRNGAKITVVHKIKGMVKDGEITDINVIRTIEKRLGIDLIAIL